MIVAGIVIETVPGAAPRVAARLIAAGTTTPGHAGAGSGGPDAPASADDLGALELQGGDGDHRLAAVWAARDGATLEAFAERLLAQDDEIVGIYPTFVGDDEDDRTT